VQDTEEAAMYTKDDKIPRHMELEDTIYSATEELAEWAGLTSPWQAARTTSELGGGVVDAVRLLGIQRRNRVAVSRAVVQHVHDLLALTTSWAAEERDDDSLETSGSRQTFRRSASGS
jgi:hypothetical protein